MRSLLVPFSNRQRNALTNSRQRPTKTILPTFNTQTEAQEEADRLNVINQSVIGAKEGVVEAVSKLVGSDITDAFLRTADGSDFKSIDDFTLYKVMKVAIDGADRPTTNDVLEQLLEVINHPFDFRKRSASTWS